MAQSPGVFSLENVEVKIREGEWATRADYWRDEPTPQVAAHMKQTNARKHKKRGTSKDEFVRSRHRLLT